MWVMRILATTLHEYGQLDEAEKTGRELLALLLDIHRGRHPDTILSSYHLAWRLYRRGQLDEVKRLLQTTTELSTEVLCKHHPCTVEAEKLMKRLRLALICPTLYQSVGALRLVFHPTGKERCIS